MSRSKRKPGRSYPDRSSRMTDQNFDRTWENYDMERYYKLRVRRDFVVEPETYGDTWQEIAGEPVRQIRGVKQPVVAASRSVEYTNPAPIAVMTPANALSVCEKRQMRREVLFATDQAGSGAMSKPKWTSESKIQCRRKK